MEVRLGQLLVESRVLTPKQVQLILEEQQRTGEPFGLLCERLFQVDPDTVERAWATQYASLTRTIDPSTEAVQSEALELVTRRQAWQFRICPIRFDDGELMIATTQQHLRRALRFATNVVGVPVFLVMAAPEALGHALCKHYPLPGMTPLSVSDNGLDQLLGDRGLRMSA
jgi:hypothetical protein